MITRLPVLLVFWSFACVHPELRHVRLPDISVETPHSPEQIWGAYMDFAIKVSQGAVYEQYQLSQVVNFFEGLTGIKSGLGLSALGYVLERERLALAIKEWDGWYAKHGTRLQWDPSRRQYHLRE